MIEDRSRIVILDDQVQMTHMDDVVLSRQFIGWLFMNIVMMEADIGRKPRCKRDLIETYVESIQPSCSGMLSSEVEEPDPITTMICRQPLRSRKR